MRPSRVKPDSRINAISVPKIRPPSAERPVSVSVNVMPSKNRYPSERRMTSKSKLANMGAGSLPRDIARDRQAALEEAHGDDHDDIDQQIQHRCGGEGPANPKGKILHPPGLARRLQQAPGHSPPRGL